MVRSFIVKKWLLAAGLWFGDGNVRTGAASTIVNMGNLFQQVARRRVYPIHWKTNLKAVRLRTAKMKPICNLNAASAIP